MISKIPLFRRLGVNALGGCWLLVSGCRPADPPPALPVSNSASASASASSSASASASAATPVPVASGPELAKGKLPTHGQESAPAVAAGDAMGLGGQQLPSPEQGLVSAGGKFSPNQGQKTGLPSLSKQELEAKLQSALNLKDLGEGNYQLDRIVFNNKTRQVSFPANVNMREGNIEYALTHTTGKAHEALLTTEVAPQDLHLVFLLIGIKPPEASQGGQSVAEGALEVPAPQSLDVTIEWQGNGPRKKVPLTELVKSGEAVAAAASSKWLYNGSQFTKDGFAAQSEGSIISLIGDFSALINNPGSTRLRDDVHVPNTGLLPVKGFPVTVVLRANF